MGVPNGVLTAVPHAYPKRGLNQHHLIQERNLPLLRATAERKRPLQVADTCFELCVRQ